MQRKTVKTPACVAGLIACLEMCLDAHARHADGFTPAQRQQWRWICAAMEVPGMTLACEKLNKPTGDYLISLLRDYNDAVFPKGTETEEESAELLLF